MLFMIDQEIFQSDFSVLEQKVMSLLKLLVIAMVCIIIISFTVSVYISKRMVRTIVDPLDQLIK